MLLFPAWAKWQGEALYDRMRKRVPSGRSKPISLAFIALATDLDDDDGDFGRFAGMVGGGILARGYLLSVLGYIGRHSATFGVVRCTRSQFGPVVLTDRTCIVSTRTGGTVYDAFVKSGMALEIAESDIREIPIPGAPPSPKPSGEVSGEGSPPSGGRRGEERRGEREDERTPLPPSVEGGVSASPVGSNGHGGNGKPLAPTATEIAICDAILTKQAAFFGPFSAQPPQSKEAQDLRAKLRAGGWTRPDCVSFIAKHLDSHKATIDEAKAAVRRDARASRRDESPTFDETEKE